MERRTLIKALLMLTFMICGMKVEKTITAENRWDNLITEISAEKERTITNSKSTEVDNPGRWKNNILKEVLL
jgi:hypothetical protein